MIHDFEQRCYPDASDIQVFRYKDAPPAYQMRATFGGIRRLLEDLDALEYDYGIFCVRYSSAEELFKAGRLPAKRFSNYSVERFGLRIEPFPVKSSGNKSRQPIRDSSIYLCQPSYWYERDDYLIQVWRTRIFARSVSSIHTSLSNPTTRLRYLGMYFEERWHPYRGKARSLHWTEPKNRSQSKIEQFKKDALLILDGTKNIGRPLGTKKLGSPAEFTLKYLEAYREVERVGEPTKELVAGEMGISTSTLYRRLIDYKLSWPPSIRPKG